MAGDYRVAYQVWGEGPITLVTVWGTMSHVEIHWEDPPFARLLERLGRSVRVVQFDRLGTGLSDRPDRLPTLEDRMDDLRAVIDAVGCSRVALLGESEGGAAAILFAATYPDRVSHLVLYGTVVRILADDDFPAGTTPGQLDELIDFMIEHWGEPQTWAPFSPGSSPERLAWGARFLRMAGSPKTFADTIRAASKIDIRPVLPTLGVPVLILYKPDDALIPSAHARYLMDHIAGATAVALGGRAHYIADDDTGRLVEATVEFVTGVRPADDIDRVLATVLFTDIVASTDKAVEMGDGRWHDLLDDHDRLVHGVVTHYRGRVIKTAGDGAFAVFDGPARAVRAGAAIAAAIRSLGLESRVGVHTGEVELRGDDVGGVGVHIGARLAALAQPGEVLVSRTVVDLVVGSQLLFLDAGVHVLKGVPGTWPLYAFQGEMRLDTAPTRDIETGRPPATESSS
jgi:class 3 adenylate cyclase